MSALVQLSGIFLRTDESKALVHKLQVNGADEDLTGWTIELLFDGVVIKTITGATDPGTVGQIKTQATNRGEYFFTLLAADLLPLAHSAVGSVKQIQAHVRYDSKETNPPRVFSNVEFVVSLKRA